MSIRHTDDPTGRPPAHRPALLRTFHPRRGRMGDRQQDALHRLWPRYGLAVADGSTEPVRPAELFGRVAPLVLEIGFGMGEATAAMAAADPARDYLGVEVHTPGIANLLTVLERDGLTNVRVVRGDAMELVRRLAPDSLAAVHAFFPDPWPKARHHKRRLIQPAHVALLRSRLAAGGVLHCATDWAPYAAAMRETLDADPGLANAFAGYAPRPAHRPLTRFEERGVQAGRQVFDLVYTRTAAPGTAVAPDRP